MKSDCARGHGRLPRWLALLAVLGVLGVGTRASAQGYDEGAAPPPDPPARVGRISLLSGPVGLTDIETGDSQTAMLNWPVTSGQTLSTGRFGRAEVRIGSLAVRLGPESDVDFERIDDSVIQVVIERGTVSLRLRNRDMLPALDLTTPRERLVLDDVGRYRIDVDLVPGLTSVTTYLGYARVATGGGMTYAVASGQRGEFSGEPVTRYQLVAPMTDTFDDWVAAIDRQDDAIRSSRYVSTETTGIESLDEYGQWRSVDVYGAVWFPVGVPVGWVPYRYGRWAWVPPWGWTWIDDAAWGFAPFHYGRWVYVNGGWGWLPGVYLPRPVYAPALVVWYGGPPAGATLGAVGWFPLGPGEIYIPCYRTSRRYVEVVNAQQDGRGRHGDPTVPPPHYIYQRNPGVVTWVDGNALMREEPVRRHVQPPPSQWTSIPVTYLPPLQASPGTKRHFEPAPAPASREAERAPEAPAAPGMKRHFEGTPREGAPREGTPREVTPREGAQRELGRAPETRAETRAGTRAETRAETPPATYVTPAQAPRAAPEPRETFTATVPARRSPPPPAEVGSRPEMSRR
ncbi:MAG TPA: DUF6600 domain-containing protein, partial [Burkholderiaceae bacterium]